MTDPILRGPRPELPRAVTDPVVHDFLYLSPFDRAAAEEWVTGSMSISDRLALTALGPHEYLYIAPDVVDLDELQETGETRVKGFHHHHYGPQSESQP